MRSTAVTSQLPVLVSPKAVDLTGRVKEDSMVSTAAHASNHDFRPKKRSWHAELPTLIVGGCVAHAHSKVVAQREDAALGRPT